MTSIHPLYSHEYYHPVHNRQIQHHMIQRKQEEVLGDCVPHLFSLDGLFQGGGANMDYHIYVVYMYVGMYMSHTRTVHSLLFSKCGHSL